ncbi:MAG: NAD(+)/NADH kinase [Oscillospiraceae bacterium]
MNVILFPSTDKPEVLKQIESTYETLLSLNVSCFMDKWFEKKLGHLNITFIDLKAPPIPMDAIVSIGGDGTILQSATFALAMDIPILGINIGRLGFLTNIEKDDIVSLKRFAQGDYFIDSRMTIFVELHSKNGVRNFTALNDVVIRNSVHTRIADLVVNDGVYDASVRADGIIIATPTGSTAYSLSAGGPIVDPSLEAFIMSSICPHALASRSVVYNANKQLIIKGVHDHEHSSSLLMDIDGKNALLIQAEDHVVIQKGKTSVKFVAFKQKSFYESSRNKLTQQF